MRNRGRILSILLSAAMLATSISTPAFAQPQDDVAEDIAEEDLGFAAAVDNTGKLSTKVSALDGSDVYTGFVPDERIPEAVHNEHEDGDSITAESLESSYGLENMNGTPVLALRNQNPHGTCWAFASVASMEASLVRQGYVSAGKADLSELQTVFYSRQATNQDRLDGFSGDSVTHRSYDYFAYGSNESMALNTFRRWNGLAQESSIPYIGYQQGYNYSQITSKKNQIFSSGLDSFMNRSDTANDKAYVLSDCQRVNYNEPDVIKQAIKDNGAVTISIYAATSETDMAANLSADKLSYYDNWHNHQVTDVNHAITVVGWDDNYSKSNFKNTPPGNGAWLVRNSWSYNYPSKHYFNYFWLSYYDTSIWPTGYSFRAIPASTYDNNYQYDGGYNEGAASVRQCASIYTTKANADGETLKAVAFDTRSSNVNYKIEIYKNVTSSTDPTSGTLVSNATTTGSLTTEGFYTIPLKNKVALPYGTKYSVVITATFANSGYPYMSYEASYNGNDFVYNVALKKGQSFYRMNTSGSWTDMANVSRGDFRIKAYTCNGMDEDPFLSIDKPTNCGDVILGPRGSFEISASYPKKVTEVSYRSSDTSVATVDSTGKVTAVANGTTTISVSIAYPLSTGGSGGLQKSFTVTVRGTSKPTPSIDSNRNVTVKWTPESGLDGVKGYYLYSTTGMESGYAKAISPFFSSGKSSYSFKDTDYAGTTAAASVGYIVLTHGTKNGVDYTLQSEYLQVDFPSIEAKNYIFRFDGNGGTGTMEDISVELNSRFTIPACGFAKSGFVFDGWNTKADGSGIDYIAGHSAVILNANHDELTTLYAQWKDPNAPDDPDNPDDPDPEDPDNPENPENPDNPRSTVKQIVDHGDGTYTLTMVKGNKIPFAKLKKEKEDKDIYRATSDNKSVATINNKGMIIAKGPGHCQITVVKQNGTYTCDVDVTIPSFESKSVALNLFDRNGMQQSVALNFSGTRLPVTYSIPSKQQSVARVDKNGNLTAFKKGKVKVTAEVCGKKYTCSVRVYDPYIKAPKTNQISVGKSVTLKVVNGVKSTTWTSEDPEIAMVNSKGKVVGVSSGITYIHAVNNGFEMVQRIVVY